MTRFSLKGDSEKREPATPAHLEAKVGALKPASDKSLSMVIVPFANEGKPRYTPDFLYIENKLPDGNYKVRFITGPESWVNHSLLFSEENLHFISERTGAWKNDPRVKAHPRYNEFSEHPRQILGYFPGLVRIVVKGR